MNVRLGKAKFHSLTIILDSGAISYILLGKHTHKRRNKNTALVKWITQEGDFQTNYNANVKWIPPEVYATKIMIWNFNVE